MSGPKVSIVIPVYNVEPYIAECLQSVMRQTYHGPMECIIVDDRGTDKSIEIAEQLIADYDGPVEFRVLHHEKNQGISVARNTGINAAIGDYIYFIDSDDWITDDCLEILVSQTRHGDYDVIVGNNDQFGRKEFGGYSIPAEGLVLSGEEYVIKYLDGLQVSPSAWNKLYRTLYLKSNYMCFVQGLLLEDQVYNFMLTCHPTTLFVISIVTYHYRTSNGIDNRLWNEPLLWRDTCFQVWLNMAKSCNKNGYVEAQELYLSVYGSRVIRISKENGLYFKDLFYRMHDLYPYNPFKIWLSGRQGFYWFIKRIAWFLPPFCGYLWVQLTWMEKKICNNAK